MLRIDVRALDGTILFSSQPDVRGHAGRARGDGPALAGRPSAEVTEGETEHRCLELLPLMSVRE